MVKTSALIEKIEEVLTIAGEDGKHRHTLFAYLILREPLLTAIHIGVAFGHMKLTAQEFQVIASNWKSEKVV